MKKILMALTNHTALVEGKKTTGFHLQELTHPLYEFERAGFVVTLISPQGGAVHLDENTRDVSEPLNRDYLGRQSFLHDLQNTLGAAEVDGRRFDAIVFVGGHGALWDFPPSQALTRLAQQILEQKGVVAAISQGVAALLPLENEWQESYLKGKSLTAASDAEEQALGISDLLPFSLENELKNKGALYSSGSLWQRHCVGPEAVKKTEPGVLITGQNPSSARAVGEYLVRQLRLHN